MSAALLQQVRGLLDDAQERASSEPVRAELSAAAARLDEPLRVALVGRVKAGKSTLLNALVGEQVAPTDAGECTRTVTWYRYGPTVRVVVHPRNGTAQQRRFERDGGALQVDLGRPAADVERVEVELPNPWLRTVTLIDTPGLDSLSTAVSDRTLHLLAADEQDRPSAADAVVYLLRHVHASDVRFLEAFGGDDLVRGTPINTLAVLSRADEIGSCRLDAMTVAARVADRYRADERLRRTCPVIVPVAGLLACAAESLREDEFRLLARIATGPREQVLDLLLTADGWADGPTRLPATPMERRHLLDRLGLYGLRLAVQLVRGRAVADGAGLARLLRADSGLLALREVLTTQFLSRTSVLTSRSALATVEGVLRAGGCSDPDGLRDRADAIRAGAHEFEELRRLQVLRSGRVAGRPERLAELDRLLGGDGSAAWARLGLAPDVGESELRAAGYGALTRSRALAENALASLELRRAAAAAARSCEGLLFALEAEPSDAR